MKSAFRLGGGGHRPQLRCGFGQLEAGYSEKDFCTTQYALVYIFEGEGHFFDEDGHDYPFKPGNVFQRFPDRKHMISLDSKVSWAFIAVPANVRGLLELLAAGSLDTPVIDSKANAEVVRKSFQLLIRELASAPANQLFKVLIKMQELINLLLFSSETESIIQLACRLIDAGIGGKVTMPGIAAELNMSYSSFRKRFNVEMGISPGKYLICKRIENAHVMLEDGQLTVGEIAGSLGYPDIYSFSRQFKKFTGLSPSAVMKNV